MNTTRRLVTKLSSFCVSRCRNDEKSFFGQIRVQDTQREELPQPRQRRENLSRGGETKREAPFLLIGAIWGRKMPPPKREGERKGKVKKKKVFVLHGGGEISPTLWLPLPFSPYIFGRDVKQRTERKGTQRYKDLVQFYY